MTLESIEVQDVWEFRGVPLCREEKFRKIIVTGPPGSGKTSLVGRLRGWPEEGYLDLASRDWWRSRILTFRPREVHFGIPFEGHEASLTVFDTEWLEDPRPIDLDRVVVPPRKRWFLGIDWGSRFVFDFQLIPPERIYEIRRRRRSTGSHPVDVALTLEIVRLQVAVYERLAAHFHHCGLGVCIRHSFDGPPRRIVDGGRADRVARS